MNFLGLAHVLFFFHFSEGAGIPLLIACLIFPNFRLHLIVHDIFLDKNQVSQIATSSRVGCKSMHKKWDDQPQSMRP